MATNVAISIKNGGSHLPKKTCFAFVLRKGGAAIINQGDGVGPGSAARNIGRTSTWESIEIGTFSAAQYQYCHPRIIADGPCLDLFGLRTCEQICSSGSFSLGNNILLPPPLNNEIVAFIR